MPRKTPGPPCLVCKSPSVSKSLCSKHYTRWLVHGDTDFTLRPNDWGERSVHPLYESWKWMARKARDPKWDDFWAFIADVGDKPSDLHRLRRLHPKQAWGPDNFYWKPTLTGKSYNTSNAEGKKLYQRDWRAANKLRSKSHELKRDFGIDMDRYLEMRDAQGGVCAICLKPDDTYEYLAVDHCHSTGRIRGLLCNKCNRALGMFRDDPERLRRALILLTGSIVAP